MVLALINRLSRWTELTVEDQAILADIPGETIRLARGCCPLRNPDPQHRSLILIDGAAARCKDLASGKRVIGELLLPGDVLLATRHPDTSLQTVMLSPGAVRLVADAHMAALLDHPRIGAALDWAISVQASIHRGWLINIGANQAYSRLAHLLCEIAARMNSAGLLDGDSCAMPLTQADLADALSMTQTHCNIALQRLRAANLIQLKHHMLTIVDRRALEAVAQFDDDYLMRWPTELPDRRIHPRKAPARERRRTDCVG